MLAELHDQFWDQIFEGLLKPDQYDQPLTKEILRNPNEPLVGMLIKIYSM